MAENVKLHAIRAFYTRRNGLVTLDDDVLSVVSQVREDYGDKVTIELDQDTGEFLFVEHCGDGTDRLIFSTSSLDPQALDRLRRADAHLRGYQDPYDAAEREQDAIQDALDKRVRERFLEHGEELAHALKKDGVMPRFPQKTSLYIPGRSDAGRSGEAPASGLHH
jgi:hypothetical protein